jgi:hypothetical protein
MHGALRSLVARAGYPGYAVGEIFDKKRGDAAAAMVIISELQSTLSLRHLHVDRRPRSGFPGNLEVICVGDPYASGAATLPISNNSHRHVMVGKRLPGPTGI